MSGLIRRPAEGRFDPAGNYQPGTIGQRFKDHADTADGTKGAKLTGYDGATAQDVLDTVKPMQSYTALRAYTGRATSVRLTAQGVAGFFYRDDADVASADNKGTIIVDASGRRWKRVYQGAHMVSWFEGADFGLKLQNSHDAMPAAGGALDAKDITGAQVFSANVTISKPVSLYLGAIQIDMAANRLLLRASGVAVYGIGKIDENNSPTRFIYSGTSDAILLQKAAVNTALFGPRLEDFELSATGVAATSASAFGISSYGTRYGVYRNIEVFNFTQGHAMYFTGNGAVVDGFGGTNQIFNPAISTCKFGILADTAGGSASTHGMVYGGFIFAPSGGVDLACESWRFHDTDLGGTPSVRLRAGADDCSFIACRWEAATSEVSIEASVNRTQIVAPSMINHQGGGPTIIDNGTGTMILTTHPTTPSKLLAVKAAVNYANSGTTASLAVGTGADVLDMSAGGTWLVAVRQADGGTGWRAAGIVWSNGVSLSVSQFAGGGNVTITNTGASLRLVNAHATDAQALAWSVLKFDGPAQF